MGFVGGGVDHRIGNAGMVDAEHFGFEHFADAGDVAEGEVAVFQLVLADFAVDDAVNELVDGLAVVVFETLAGGFDAVDNHDDGSFAGVGGGARVLEVGDVEGLVGMLVDLLGVEVAGDGSAVVCADEVLNRRREVVFFCQLET